MCKKTNQNDTTQLRRCECEKNTTEHTCTINNGTLYLYLTKCSQQTTLIFQPTPILKHAKERTKIDEHAHQNTTRSYRGSGCEQNRALLHSNNHFVKQTHHNTNPISDGTGQRGGRMFKDTFSNLD